MSLVNESIQELQLEFQPPMLDNIYAKNILKNVIFCIH